MLRGKCLRVLTPCLRIYQVQQAFNSNPADVDPLSMSEGYMTESDPFAPPGVEKKSIKVKIPQMLDIEPGFPSRTDPTDPSHWSYEEVIAWIERSYNDPEIPLDKDLVDAYSMNKTSGQDLMNLNPNSLFKEMRRQHIKSSYVPQVNEMLLRETCLLSFKYGGQDSLW